MLVLERRPTQRILIGDDVIVTVVHVGKGKVRIGVEAPDGKRIDREEVRRRIEAEGEGPTA